ncbi:MAG: general stress protein, partial [Chloroflexi bacterium]|nr:general stress protein [Chloroflexota bacterium]
PQKSGSVANHPLCDLAMYTTDLWLALLDKDNPRSHPLLAALLYAFCPAAARWWLAGSDPALLPFNPVWQALKDLSSGETLKAALTRYGFEDILDEAKRYVDDVDAYRRTHPGIDAPETLPTFPGGRMSLDRRFGLTDAITNLGKDWSNFFAYIRAWAFLCPDWEAKIQFFAAPELSHVRLALTLPGIRRPAYLPAWLWTVKQGYATRLVIGLPMDTMSRMSSASAWPPALLHTCLP